MVTSNTLKINFVLFTLFLSLITVPVDAKTGSGKATETEISLVDGITLDKKGNVYIAMREHNIINQIENIPIKYKLCSKPNVKKSIFL